MLNNILNNTVCKGVWHGGQDWLDVGCVHFACMPTLWPESFFAFFAYMLVIQSDPSFAWFAYTCMLTFNPKPSFAFHSHGGLQPEHSFFS
jgi:hypothetical protein